MSQYTRLSIWEDQPHSISWYDHVAGHKPATSRAAALNSGPAPELTSVLGESHVNYARDVSCQDEWFNTLKAQDRRRKSWHPSSIGYAALILSLEPSPNLPPTISGLLDSDLLKQNHKTLPLDPYFEYLFADAGVAKKSCCAENSIDNLSFGKPSHSHGESFMTDPFDSPSPPEWRPTTPEPEKNEVQFVDVGALRQLELHDTNNPEPEKAIFHDAIQTICGNLNIIDSKLHSVSVQQTTGIHFLPTASSPQLSPGLRIEDLFISSLEQRHPSQIFSSQRQDRRILRPKSRKVNNLRRLPSQLKTLHRQPNSVLQIPENDTTAVVRKRSAEAIEVDDTTLSLDPRSCSKKRRLCLEVEVRESSSQTGQHLKCDARQSLISDVASSRNASEDFFTHKPLAIAPKGYAGQFDGMIINNNYVADFKFNLRDIDIGKSGVRFTFGDPRHPNGIYTHTSMTFDPRSKNPDFAKEHLPIGHPLLTCMHFATDMTIAACDVNIVKLRGHDEEILRRESHVECAYARLEGVAVGYYRYYQGHLNIEEYHEAEMCVC